MFRNILISVDGSAHSSAALSEAIDIASLSGARLTVLTAVPHPNSWAGGSMAVAAATAYMSDDLEAEYTQILRDAVELIPDSIPVTKILTHEPIRTALRSALATGHHDVLVMGSRGRGAFSASVLGSVSHYALNHSPIAVLIVHAPEPEPTAEPEPGAQARVPPSDGAELTPG